VVTNTKISILMAEVEASQHPRPIPIDEVLRVGLGVLQGSEILQTPLQCRLVSIVSAHIGSVPRHPPCLCEALCAAGAPAIRSTLHGLAIDVELKASLRAWIARIEPFVLKRA